MQISIRAGLSLGIVATVLATAAIVHLPWSITAQRSLEELNGRVNEAAVHGIAEKIDGLLDNAVAVRQALATNIVNRSIDIEDGAQRQFLFLSFLQSQPGLTAIEFAWPDDHALMAIRQSERGVRLEESGIEERPGQRLEDSYLLNDNGEYIFQERATAPSDYKPTQQLWYFTAFDKDAPPWSNIYLLGATGGAGVTTSQPVVRNGDLIGALGLSISLDRLSDFLDGIAVSRNGSVFLTNIYDELVAAQRRASPAGAAPQSGRGIAKLPQASEPGVQVAVAALAEAGLALGDLEGNRQLSVTRGGERYLVSLTRLSQMDLIAAVVMPERDVLGGINRNIALLGGALLVFILLVGAAATVVARRTLGLPLARVTDNLKQLEEFRLERVAAVPSRIAEIAQVSAATLRMSSSLASFRKYIPTELVRTLFALGVEAELGGEQRELTLLFMDIEGFTGISERLGDALPEFLGTYLSEMSEELQAGGATIDKYIGDAIMAFWGAPVARADHALAACRAALAAQARLARTTITVAGARLPTIRARIGLNSGRVLVGNVGSRDRLNYTAIGDAVNVASRLEALNKLYGTAILIGENTRHAAGDAILVRSLDRVAVYGKEQGIEIFELLALREAVTPAMLAWLALYREAQAALRARDWSGAIERFEEVIALRGADSVASLQIARAQRFREAPPPAGWDGMVVMETK